MLIQNISIKAESFKAPGTKEKASLKFLILSRESKQHVHEFNQNNETKSLSKISFYGEGNWLPLYRVAGNNHQGPAMWQVVPKDLSMN